ncbi:MAG: hypothetical protein GY929_08865 [Actinomycetia bacterium]|nr:hypothetical protein [Actinomycetes bacterium]
MICSDEFGPLGRAEAQVLGVPGLALIPIPHPLADNHDELVDAKARAIADEVEHALTAPAVEVAERHRDRFVGLTQRRLEAGALCLDDACAIDLALTGQDQAAGS